MKKIIFALTLALITQLPIAPGVAFAQSQVYYGQVRENDVAFFQSANLTSAIFNLPVSFFVEIYGKDGDFYKARYMDLDGYVKMSDVTVVNEIPSVKFPESATVTVNTSLGVKLLPSPHLSSDESAPTLAAGESNITYYGTIGGDKVNDNPAEWIYCKFDNQRGYIYANDCKINIVRVTGPFTEFEGELFATHSASKGLSAAAKTFIILGVSIPCALIIFLLIKPSLSGQAIKTKVKTKKRRKGDYFEFDENDLS